MSNAILIGKLIYAAIEQDSYTYSYVGTRVFPLVADMDTDFPFIVYSKTNVYDGTGTKDGWIDDKVSFSVTVVSDEYNESCEVANYVRNIFDNSQLSNDELLITNTHMTSIMESMNGDAFVQTMNFDCDAE